MAKINADEYFLCNCVIVVPSEKPMREDASTLANFSSLVVCGKLG